MQFVTSGSRLGSDGENMRIHIAALMASAAAIQKASAMPSNSNQGDLNTIVPVTLPSSELKP